MGIVADSTGYLPEALRPDGLVVVPVQVIVDGQAHDEGTGISPAQVVDALRRRAEVSTSRPSPQTFRLAYEAMAREGIEEVVSIHLSADLSGTYDAATLAARDAPIRVHVMDSRTVGLAMGLAVVQACRDSAAGASAAEIMAGVAHRCAGSRTWLVVDSLEQLRRGGRIGAAQALLGSALMIKPILQVVDGHVAPLEKQRTLGRAVARMAEVAVEFASGGSYEVAVQHVAAPDRAEDLASRLSRSLPGAAVHTVEVGAVISAHVGLGTISIALSPC